MWCMQESLRFSKTDQSEPNDQMRLLEFCLVCRLMLFGDQLCDEITDEYWENTWNVKTKAWIQRDNTQQL